MKFMLLIILYYYYYYYYYYYCYYYIIIIIVIIIIIIISSVRTDIPPERSTFLVTQFYATEFPSVTHVGVDHVTGSFLARS